MVLAHHGGEERERGSVSRTDTGCVTRLKQSLGKHRPSETPDRVKLDCGHGQIEAVLVSRDSGEDDFERDLEQRWGRLSASPVERPDGPVIKLPNGITLYGVVPASLSASG